MPAQIQIEKQLWDGLGASLTRPEHAAFMLAEVEDSTFHIVDLRVMRPEDYKSRSGLHLGPQGRGSTRADHPGLGAAPERGRGPLA